MGFTLTDPIPTGAWKLYYHNPSDTKWTPESYQYITTAKTWEDFFAAMREMQEVCSQYGMLFWMRDGVPPL